MDKKEEIFPEFELVKVQFIENGSIGLEDGEFPAPWCCFFTEKALNEFNEGKQVTGVGIQLSFKEKNNVGQGYWLMWGDQAVFGKGTEDEFSLYAIPEPPFYLHKDEEGNYQTSCNIFIDTISEEEEEEGNPTILEKLIQGKVSFLFEDPAIMCESKNTFFKHLSGVIGEGGIAEEVTLN